jgi:hypothetical protein
MSQNLSIAFDEAHVLCIGPITLVGRMLQGEPVSLRGPIPGQEDEGSRIRRTRSIRCRRGAS